MDAEPPGLFEGTAPYYARFRPPYPDALFDLLIEVFDLGPGTSVLDVGCGTGQISIPLAARGLPVRAVDPDIAMLAEGIASEARAGVQGVAWSRADDTTLASLHLPPLRLCTFGASFHWTHRDEVLKTLDGYIDDHGGVAVLSGSASVWRDGEQPEWADIARQVVVDFLGPERRAGAGSYSHPPERHETVLSRSPFPRVDRTEFVEPETMTVDDIVGLQLSTSYASPRQLGARLDDFRSELCRRLLDLEPTGTFSASRRSEVLVARR